MNHREIHPRVAGVDIGVRPSGNYFYIVVIADLRKDGTMHVKPSYTTSADNPESVVSQLKNHKVECTVIGGVASNSTERHAEYANRLQQICDKGRVCWKDGVDPLAQDEIGNTLFDRVKMDILTEAIQEDCYHLGHLKADWRLDINPLNINYWKALANCVTAKKIFERGAHHVE